VSVELAGRVGIVTGAATGIGKAIAIAMAAVGGRVVVNDLNTPDRAEAVVA
jgi:NAD(P)-dependent dehydrogenase (short-subunit alcohol dehydrogenase family)